MRQNLNVTTISQEIPPSTDVSHCAPTALNDEVIHTQLTDGTAICIRTIGADDEERMRNGISELSAGSRYFRFFSSRPIPSDSVIQKLVNVDGHNHLAWGAILSDNYQHPAIGAVHVFRDGEEKETGEYAVAIVDAYHGLGLARMLTAVLLINCQHEKIASLDVQVLFENKASANLIRSLGGQRASTSSSVLKYTLDTALALQKLRCETENKGLRDVFQQLAKHL